MINLEKIIDIGKDEQTDQWLAGKIRLVNLMCLSTYISVLGMIIVNLFISRNQYLTIIAGLIAVIMIVPYYLNHKRRYIGARIAFIILAYIGICSLAIVFGKEFFFQYYLVPGVGMPLIFFRSEIKRKKWILTFAGIPVWLFLEFWFVHFPPLITIDGELVNYISYFSSFLIFITSITMFYTFSKESDHHLEKITKMNIQLKKLVHFDSLTGLYNRYYITDQLSGFFEIARRQNSFLALAMFDIDHFKMINDTYGHDAGDKVLQILSKLTKESLRKTDLVGRVGGEEFCIIFTTGDRDHILEVIERIRNLFFNQTVIYENTTITFTASFGIAFISENLKSYENLYKNADKALYKAKETGRNRLCEYAPEL